MDCKTALPWMQRINLPLLPFLMCAFWVTACTNSVSDRFVNDITVEVEVVTADGDPIPYVTILHGRTPYTSNSDFPYRDLTGEDIQRITQRYKNSASSMHRFNTPVDGLRTPELTDENGIGEDVVAYRGQPNIRADLVELSYSFIKEGYEAKTETIVASRNQNSYRLRITLNEEEWDNPSAAQTLARHEFDSIRYELSDSGRNAQISPENRDRIESLRQRLLNLADSALEENDNTMAATVLAYISRMPEVDIYETASGFQVRRFYQTNPTSERNTAILTRACGIDTDDAYMKRLCLFLRNASVAAITDETQQHRARLEIIQEYESVKETYGRELWPDFFLALHGHYREAGFYTNDIEWFKKAEAELKTLSEEEPKYINYDNALSLFYRQVERYAGFRL